MARRPRLAALDEKEAGKVFLVILDSGLQDFCSVDFGCPATGDGRGIAQALGHDMLHASGRVVERHRLELGIFGEEVAALIECDRMREHAAHICQPGARQRDEVMHDAQAKLAEDVNVAPQEQIKMFGDGTRERVLNRNDSAVDRSPPDPVEDLQRTRTRHDLRQRQHGLGRLMAKGAKFSLDRNFHETFL